MTLSIADQLKKRIKEKNLSIKEVERRAGLKMNAVRNIIGGTIKNPSAQTLKVIADVLECSVDDILEAEEPGFPSTVLEKNTGLSLFVEDPALFLKIADAVMKIKREKDYKITLEQALNLIRGVYAFSVKKKRKTIDTSFVEWFFEETINS